MYQNANMYNYPYVQDDRFVGGFLGPFILGGLTGGLLAPAFYNNGYNKPAYNNYYYYPYPYNYQYYYPYYY